VRELGLPYWAGYAEKRGAFVKYPENLSIRSEPVLSVYDQNDAILYGLSVGMGQDPLNAKELVFVYEKDMSVLPTMSAILTAGVGEIINGSEINVGMLVHGEQRLRVHRPLPPQASVLTQARCLSVVDKGPGRGAILNIECTITEPGSNDPYTTSIMSLFCRGDGGFDGPVDGAIIPHEVPTRTADKQVMLPTRPEQALLYRLNGDPSPLHCDMEVAQRAGFERPILHGLCTYGFACRAVLRAYCDYDVTKIKSFDARFVSPVYPGETIVTHLWKDGPVVSFECRVAERDAIVIRNGRCLLG
jgi:acyl dehydratase